MSVTIKDIANETGLSWPTVSRILNGKGHLFKTETRDRVVKKAEEMGYVPNAAARGIRTNKTYHVGALLLNRPGQLLHYPASFEILQGINQSLEQAGYVLSLIRIQDLEDQDRLQHSRVFREKMLDGIICLDALPENLVVQVKQLMRNCIWLDANHKESENCVFRDEFQVGEIAAQNMFDLGYRKLVFVHSAFRPNSTFKHYSLEVRCQGVMKRCQKLNVAFDKVVIPHWKNPIDAQQTQALWLEPAGLIFNGSHDAMRLMHQAHLLNLPVSKEIGICCCDMTEDTLLACPDMAHVINDRFELGKEAAQMMLKLLDNPKVHCPSKSLPGIWKPGNTALGPQ